MHTSKLRVTGRLIMMSYEEAYESDESHASKIAALGVQLCGDVPFVDEATGFRYVVVSVERNGDKELVNKTKPHLKFTGIVAWALHLPAWVRE